LLLLLESNILKFRVGGVDLNVFMSNVELRPFEEILFCSILVVFGFVLISSCCKADDLQFPFCVNKINSVLAIECYDASTANQFKTLYTYLCISIYKWLITSELLSYK